MTTFAPNELEYCRRLIHETAGLCMDERKDYLFESRLRGLFEEFGLKNASELVQRLQRPESTDLRARVVDAMTTNETSFFRDVHPFDALREQVLPELIEARRDRRQLDVWCGASSTGQEPYTLAMVLRAAAPELQSWRVRVLATDLSERVLTKARSGWYSDVEVGRGLPEELRVRFFERDGVGWRVRAEVRDMVEFRQMNLTTAWPPLARMDIVFLRNVLIYFDVETKKRILGKIHDLLAPDGYLCLGTAETVLGIREDFRPARRGRATFYTPIPVHVG